MLNHVQDKEDALLPTSLLHRQPWHLRPQAATKAVSPRVSFSCDAEAHQVDDSFVLVWNRETW